MDPAVWMAEKCPVVAAATAAAYRTSAVASLKSASPSRMATSRLGMPSLRAMLVAAAASVGPTAVPSTNAIGHDRCPTQCATAATATAVATTSSTASTPIERALRENAVGEEVIAASYTSSGSRPSRTTSGCSETSGTNGRNPMIRPATTSTTGGGISARRPAATANRVTAATPMTMSSWPECTVTYLPPPRPASKRQAGLVRPRVTIAGMDAMLGSCSLDRLRKRQSFKWRAYPADVLPSFVAEMDFDLAEPIIETVRAALAIGDTGYPHQGQLGEAFAAFAAKRLRWPVDPDTVFAIPDVMTGIAEMVQALTPPGSAIVINPPVYPPFFFRLGFTGRRIVQAPLRRDAAGRYDLDPEALDQALAAEDVRAYLLCNPHNPTGRVWSREQLLTVADICQRHGALLLADEIHAPLALPGAEHVSVLSLDHEVTQRSVVFTSASKGWNIAGLKCGVAVAGAPGARARAGRALWRRCWPATSACWPTWPRSPTGCPGWMRCSASSTRTAAPGRAARRAAARRRLRSARSQFPGLAGLPGAAARRRPGRRVPGPRPGRARPRPGFRHSGERLRPAQHGYLARADRRGRGPDGRIASARLYDYRTHQMRRSQTWSSASSVPSRSPTTG